MKVERRLAAIMMADAAGYSRLMSQDESATVRTLIAHRGEMDLLIAEHGGRIANTAGDSVLAEFASAGDALRAAIAVQERLGAINAGMPDERRLEFRIGVHVGEVVPRGEDLLGDGVNIAARVQGLAPRGGVSVSAAAYTHVRKMESLTFEDLGPQRLKNLEEPMRVFAVRSKDAAAADSAALRSDGSGMVETFLKAQTGPGRARPRPVMIAGFATVALCILGLAFGLTRRPEPPAISATLEPAAAPLATPAGPIARLFLLTAPAGGSCQAQLYQLQPRFGEVVLDLRGDEPMIEIDGRGLCGLAVAGAAFQRGSGSALVPSHSSPTRIVFAQNGQPIIAPALLLPGGGRAEIRIK